MIVPMTVPSADAPAQAVATAHRELYLDAGTPVFGLVDAPERLRGDAAVLLLGPFGWEDICSFRARRAWAKHLAANGHPVLRLDLPGTGDSAGGPRDPDLLEAWTRAASVGAQWLASEGDEAVRVVALGVGLGGIVAHQAVLAGAPIDDLVLWGVPRRGRSFVRELRAFARLEASRLAELNPGYAPEPDEEGAVVGAGFRLAAETVVALERVDLTTPGLPEADRRRVLALGRDGVGPDAHLTAAYESAGAAVAVGAGTGWAEMMAVPHAARPPWATIELVGGWLAGGRTGVRRRRRGGAAPVATASAALTVDGERIRESTLIVDGAHAVVSEPADPADRRALTLLLLNAGAIRRIGPNRMWVELSRRWASRGVTCVRVDLAGIGEAEGADSYDDDETRLYDPRFVTQVRTLLDALEARGTPAHFGSLGLCSGAYWSLQAAAADDRVRAPLLLNPRALVWDAALPTVRETQKLRQLTRLVTYRRVLRGDIALGRASDILRALGLRGARLAADAARALAGRARRHGAGDPVDALLDGLREAGKRPFVLFTTAEPLRLELERSGQLGDAARWPNLHVELVPSPSDVHTLHPPPLQARVHELVDAAIARELAITTPPRREGPVRTPA